MRSVPERRHIVALALAGMLSVAPFPVWAERMEPGDLETLQREIDTTRERQLELEAQAAAARAEAEALRRKLIGTAARVQSFEADVSDSEARLQGLTGAEAVLTAQLERRRSEMADLLAALSRLDRHPPPALAVRPDDALASLRSALLLGAIVPELQADAQELRERLEQLAALRQGILDERVTLEATQTSLDAEREELQALLNRQEELQQKLTREAEAEQARAEALSRQATDLSDLIARLEEGAANRLPAARPDPASRPAPETVEPARPAPTAQEPAPQEYAMLRPPVAAPAMPSSRLFSDARGLIRPPAAGAIVRTYGSETPGGGKAQGITISTRPDAQIVAPFDGRISYAGPFRQYGQLLIISVGEGYHILLAGMNRIDCVVGQNVLAGEPIGKMGAAPAGRDMSSERNAGEQAGAGPALYIEFRKEGDPVDPRPWLLMSDEKVRG
jgi:septal ring factor EnvC (AmiA/AmiB activator)